MVLAVVTRIGVVVVDLAVSTYTIFDKNITYGYYSIQQATHFVHCVVHKQEI